MGAVRVALPRSRRSLSGISPLKDAPEWRGGWSVSRRIGPPEELVSTQPELAARRLARFCRPTASAIVLGSTQSPAEIDDQRRLGHGFELVKRRSGGGAVVVAPAAQVWVDLFVPRDDPLHDGDVARAACFVADLWSTALVSSAVSEASVEPIRAFAPTRFSRSVCFLGLGPGEVTIGGDKVVGVSQRRDRSGAWFFTMALLHNAQRVLSDLLVLEEEDRPALASELESRIGAVAVSADVLEGAVERALVGGC